MTPSLATKWIRESMRRAQRTAEGAPLDAVADLFKPWTPPEQATLERDHLALPFALETPAGLSDDETVLRCADGRHKGLTSLARRMDQAVRGRFGLPAIGSLEVERRQLDPKSFWRDREGLRRRGYGIVCGGREVWIGGTISEARMALQVGVSP